MKFNLKISHILLLIICILFVSCRGEIKTNYRSIEFTSSYFELNNSILFADSIFFSLGKRLFNNFQNKNHKIYYFSDPITDNSINLLCTKNNTTTDEFYKIIIETNFIIIFSNSLNGMKNAINFLLNSIERHNNIIPCSIISDYKDSKTWINYK